MKHRIPPLNYLRPFEATARLGSTVLAAEELGRTHGAISRQLKLLEDWLEVELFNREHGRLVLTPAGQRYLEATSRILRLLEQATGSLMKTRDDNTVRVHSPTVFASRWLIPRITRFYKQHPKLEIRISNDTGDATQEGAEFDVAISMTPGGWTDMDVTPLMPDLIFPICETSVSRRAANEQALPDHDLIQTNDTLARWDHWLDTDYASNPIRRRYLQIADPEVALQAVARGQGLAVARGQLVFDDLMSNRLCNPVRKAIQIDTAYWLVRPPYVQDLRAVKTFINWLRAEAIHSFDRFTNRSSLWEYVRV